MTVPIKDFHRTRSRSQKQLVILQEKISRTPEMFVVVMQVEHDILRGFPLPIPFISSRITHVQKQL